jgi:DNA/RNA-binding domain of Phe-tRNA-synthetase-like protein
MHIDFSISDAVASIGVRGVYFAIEGVENSGGMEQFEPLFKSGCERVLNEVSRESLKADPVLVGFRDLHSAVGRSNSKNIASPENLLRLLEKRRELPRINLLVDIYNLVSIQTRLAIGAHDLAAVTGNIQLRMTDGTETFLPLGQTETQKVDADEYCYVDDGNDVICRMETRQVEKTKVTADTKNVFYIVQGNLNTPEQDILNGARNLIDLTTKFCGGRVRFLHPKTWPVEIGAGQ